MSRISLARARLLAPFAAPVLLASALGACSSIPDWVDPTGWFGSDSQADSDQSSATDASQTSDSGQTPDLAGIPPKPAAPSTPDEQQQVANSLAADRAQAQYSAEALQGGTEPVAAPPPAESSTAPDTAAAPPAAPATADNTASSETSTSMADSSAAPTTAADAAAQPAAVTNSSNTQLASTELPSTAAPATAPMAAATSSAPPAVDRQASFAPSHAPALDPSVAQYVPQRILSRYQQTAVAAAVPGVGGMSSAAPKPVHHHKTNAAQTEPTPDTTAPPGQ